MTKLDYLENTYRFESEGGVLEVSENEFGKYIILDKTIFYPQGGGQPSDIGEISLNDQVLFEVNNVRLSPEGIVYHYGEFKSGINKSINGKSVSLKINKEVRIQNAKNHTAGHLIDLGVSNLGLNIKATKGFHFKTGPYVEYSGIIEDDEQELIKRLENELEKLVNLDLKIIIENGLAGNSPEGKDYRFVYFEGYKGLGCGCGGTHVSSTSELGKITIRKIKSKKGITKISYNLNQSN